jgi:hypothetical protein
MPRRNWRGTITAAVAIFIAFCLFMTGLDTGHRQQQIQDANEQETSTPQKLETNCSSLSGVELVRCVASQIEAQREARHDAQDLVAQQQSAQWATVAALTAIGGLVATIIGVIFVWQSLGKTAEALRLARKANKIARKLGQAQTRAYLSITKLALRVEGGAPFIDVTVANAGQSPARKVEVVIKYDFTGVSGPPSNEFPSAHGHGVLWIDDIPADEERGVTNTTPANMTIGDPTIWDENMLISSAGLDVVAYADDVFGAEITAYRKDMITWKKNELRSIAGQAVPFSQVFSGEVAGYIIRNLREHLVKRKPKK